jgi:xanthine dehydrogenase accessory factor
MDFYRQILERPNPASGLVLGTVIHAAGSTPQKPGCQALLDSNGAFSGTLGGGLVEAEAIAAMRAALAHRRPTIFDRRLDEAYSRTAGPICGGVMRIFINPRVVESREAIARGLAALANRQRALFVTHMGAGNGIGRIDCVETGIGTPLSALAADAPVADELFVAEEPALLRAADGSEVFVEPLKPSPRLLIVGGGHVGQAVAQLTSPLGFETTVIDDRQEYAGSDRFPGGVASAHGDPRRLVAEFPKDRDTYIVLVSKGHKPDAEALEACIHDEVAFLGMIGSRRKIRFIRKDFLERGLSTEAEFDRVVAPIGYEIGAITVPEIAVSIVAQLIAARRKPAAVRDIATKPR